MLEKLQTCSRSYRKMLEKLEHTGEAPRLPMPRIASKGQRPGSARPTTRLRDAPRGRAGGPRLQTIRIIGGPDQSEPDPAEAGSD